LRVFAFDPVFSESTLIEAHRTRSVWRLSSPSVGPALLPDIAARVGFSPGAPPDTLAPRERVAEGRVRATRNGVLPVREALRPYAVDIAPEGGLRLRLDIPHPKLSLCMIVRDNAKTLPARLESIRPWVDEMIVVDTGSVDETPRIVESSGAKLFHFHWCDDFSAARNESLRHATGDWLFWMDSDDTITPECGRGLRELVEN
jgi:hypothetical protein